MTNQLPEQTNTNPTATQKQRGSVHAWWERNKTRNVIVVVLLIIAAIIGLGNLVTAVETVTKLIVSEPTPPTTGAKPSLGSGTAAPPTPQTPAQTLPPIQILLIDGTTVTILWGAQVQIMPQDAPVYAVEFNGMADVQNQLVADFKRNLLRKTASLERKELLSLRPQLEDDLTKELRTAFGPRGVTIQSISLGEIRPD